MYQDDTDAVLDIKEWDFLEHDDEFQQDLNLAVEITSYACSFRDKVCLSKGGCTKHFNTKCHLEIAEPNIRVTKMLQPDNFNKILQKSLNKLAQECCPGKICNHFSNFRMSFSVADDLVDNLIAPIVKPFNIDFGKFYSNFYKVLWMLNALLEVLIQTAHVF